MDDISHHTTDETVDDNADSAAIPEQEVAEPEADDNTPPTPAEEEEVEGQEDEVGESPPPKAVIQPGRDPKSAIGAMMFSLCLMGGVGHIYLGQKRKGIFIIILALLLSCVGLDFPILIIGAIDAFVIARRLQQRRPVGLWECFFNRRKPQLPPFPDEEEVVGEDGVAETQGQALPGQQAQTQAQPGVAATATTAAPPPPPPVMTVVPQQIPMTPLVASPHPSSIPVIPVTPAPQPPQGNQGDNTGGEDDKKEGQEA